MKTKNKSEATETPAVPPKAANKSVKEQPPVSAPKSAAPKRMVLKTLKRAVAAPPSPTLHRVSGVMTRRVIPKAPPPKPVPPPPPPEKPVEKAPSLPPPVEKKPELPAPIAKAAPAPKVTTAAPPAPVAAPVLKELKKPADAKKEHPKNEPTATYKMPPPAPIKARNTKTGL